MAKLALFAVLCVPAAASLSAVSRARLFLRNHAAEPPKGDELAELNKENPEAYALVKALLTKRSLGLLNNRHPTASFAPAKQEELPEEDRGTGAFAKFASPEELQASHQESLVSSSSKVDLPYANVAPAGQHDWLSWKPGQDSGESDEQMVQNVLGAVASLKGGKKSGLLSKQRSSENTLSADESSFGVEAEPAAAPVAKPVQSAPPAPRENSYLKTVDFGLGSTESAPVAKPAAPKKNSYLDGLDLSGDMPEKVAAQEEPKKTSQIEQGNALSSFSWDDSKPKEQEQPKVQQLKPNGKDNALLGWLGVVEKAPAPKAEAPAPPSNPYLMDLSN